MSPLERKILLLKSKLMRDDNICFVLTQCVCYASRNPACGL
uniref:Uncharacterized protein n=1 Tax=Rhizophora mucronata TaxID=61149 RepID=A0A2P2R540_RHIMU